jgi:sugar phosphate isomerase/epimerase
MAKDFLGSLRKVADAGYAGVEFAGFGGLSAADLSEHLKQLNLKAVGSHVSLERIRDHLEEELDYHKTLGVESVAVPWLTNEYRNAEGLKEVVSILNHAGKSFSEAGIQFGYHNHDFEFHTRIDNEFFLDALFTKTSTQYVFAELDTAWIHHAGQNAADYVRKYANRVPVIHVKDLLEDREQLFTTPLGEGNVPLDAILQAAASSGVNWLVVEQDNLGRDAWDSITASREWLKAKYA